MSEFDFFAEVRRSIAIAEVAPGESSPCRIDPNAVPPEPVQPTHHHTADSASEGPVEALESSNFRIELDTGEVIEVSSGALLGRQPSPQAIAADDDVVLVPLTDDESLISRTHLFIYAVAGGLEALDLGSTNGTVLRRADRTAALPPNQPVKVRSGDKLELGVRIVELRQS